MKNLANFRWDDKAPAAPAACFDCDRSSERSRGTTHRSAMRDSCTSGEWYLCAGTELITPDDRRSQPSFPVVLAVCGSMRRRRSRSSPHVRSMRGCERSAAHSAEKLALFSRVSSCLWRARAAPACSRCLPPPLPRPKAPTACFPRAARAARQAHTSSAPVVASGSFQTTRARSSWARRSTWRPMRAP